MPQYAFAINNVLRTVEAEPDMPLLWVLRDLLNTTGTKYGVASECVGHAPSTSTAKAGVPARHRGPQSTGSASMGRFRDLGNH